MSGSRDTAIRAAAARLEVLGSTESLRDPEDTSNRHDLQTVEQVAMHALDAAHRVGAIRWADE